MQLAPIVLNSTSRSVFLKWTRPMIPNGIVLTFRINSFELKPQLIKSMQVMANI